MAIAFGRYELLKKLAAGGMGQVFLARKKGVGFEKLVVLKRILPHLVEDEEFFTMFLDEARLTARLNHPNIAQIFDVEAEAGQHLVVMEYVQGEDVRRVEKRARAAAVKLPIGVICRIIADAAAGLDYAHKARDDKGQPLGIVHRDISPQNVLVGFDGGVKLIDFGVAKAAGRAQHTATGVLKGKFPYMSPEQAEGLEIDARSDIFALGIVMWELLCDKRLFKGDSDVMSQRLVKACQVPAPSMVDPSIPKSLDALVLKALAKDRDERFQDATAFRLAIEDFTLETTTPASSAHLSAFMQKLYADRIAQLADPSQLDELPADSDIEGFGPRVTMATPVTSSKSMVRRSQVGFPSNTPDGMPDVTAQAMTERVDEMQRRGGGSSKAPLFAFLGVLAVGGIGATAFFTMQKQQAQVTPPVEAKRPVDAPVKQADPPVKLVEPEKPAALALKVQSEPAGAQVELEGRNVGVTPVDVSVERTHLPAVIKLSHDGFEPLTTTVTESTGPLVSMQLVKKPVKHGGKKEPALEIKTGR
jgi:serine/threonine-protein kinase